MRYPNRIHRLIASSVLGGLYCFIAGAFWPCAAFGGILPGGSFDDDLFSIVYHAETGDLDLDYVIPSLSGGLRVINITSEAGIFTGALSTDVPGGLGPFGYHEDNQIFYWHDNPVTEEPFSLGNVAEPGLAEEFLLRDLTAVGLFDSATEIGPVDLIYIPVPEPSTAVLCVFGLYGIVGFRWSHKRRRI